VNDERVCRCGLSEADHSAIAPWRFLPCCHFVPEDCQPTRSRLPEPDAVSVPLGEGRP